MTIEIHRPELEALIRECHHAGLPFRALQPNRVIADTLFSRTRSSSRPILNERLPDQPSELVWPPA